MLHTYSGYWSNRLLQHIKTVRLPSQLATIPGVLGTLTYMYVVYMYLKFVDIGCQQFIVGVIQC